MGEIRVDVRALSRVVERVGAHHEDPFDAERDAWTSAYAQAVLDVATGSLLPSQEFGDLAGRICRE